MARSVRYATLVPMFCALFAIQADPGARASGPGAPALTFLQAEATTARRAVFAHFLAYVPDPSNPGRAVDGAISVSNVCASPPEVALFIGDASPKGRVILHLYHLDGTHISYVTGPNSPGAGLDANGELGPGQTWTVRLAEVLAAARGIPETQVTDFRGYAWILAEFDCLAGTYTNTIFGLGFSQAYEMSPAMGQGGFFGGVQVPSP